MCFAEHVFLLDLARVQLLPSAAASRKEPRNAVCNAHGTCITFLLSRQAENLSPRGRTEEEHERAALLTVHNLSSRFLCPWQRACSASPCLPRPALKLFAYIPAWYHVYIVYISPYTRVYARISTGRTLIVMKSFSSLTVRPPVKFYCNSYYI